MLAAEPPYPLAGGGAFRTASLLHYLARTRPVDIILFRQPGAPDPACDIPPGLVRRAVTIDLPPTRRGAAARFWRNAFRLVRETPPLMDRYAGFGDRVGEAVGGRRYELGVVEHFWCAPYWEWIAPACDRTILDLHNIESVLHLRCAAVESGPAAFGHKLFAEASRDLERLWLPRYSLVLTASDADAKLARTIAPTANVEVFPNSIPWAPPPPRAEEEVIVFSGNMEYHPNIEAVRFFRAEVWPRLRQRWPHLKWRLLGKNPESVMRYVSDDPRIEATGPVTDAVLELARAKAAVVPLLAGSGTRFKILEAWAAGTPVVSTRLGAEGLPARNGENLLLADSGPAFAEAVSALLADPCLRQRIAAEGRRVEERDFTWESVWRRRIL